MPVSQEAAVDAVKMMLAVRQAEIVEMDSFADYLHGRQEPMWIAQSVPQEIRAMLKTARVNIMGLVVSALSQALFVDGYRTPKEADDSPAWDIWQANHMDARQIAVHRAALTYAVAYATVLPGDPVPVIKGMSPRRMTTVYTDDADWPMWGLEVHDPIIGQDAEARTVTLWGDDALYDVEVRTPKDGGEQTYQFLELRTHNAGVTPIVRFLNQQDLDDEGEGEVEPLIEIQEQINRTTFELLTAQHFAAFRQRWIIGWTDASEEDKLKAAVNRIWTFEDENVKVGDFAETDLQGYLDSRESSIRHAASISQTPAHELLGQLVNLSAEALVAAEASQRRKVMERQTSFGESWEQTLELATKLNGGEVDVTAQVRWRDTESRALAATVDALGKMAQMLGVPPEALWERIPGVTQQDLARWKALADEADPLRSLGNMLERQNEAAA